MPCLTESRSPTDWANFSLKAKRTKPSSGILEKGYWNNREHRMQFVLDFAKEMGFDPKIEQNWKARDSQFKAKAGSLRGWYGNSLRAMLEDLFPSEQGQSSKAARDEDEGYWANPENRRQFLLTFAKKMRFDPLDISSWDRRERVVRAHGVGILLSSSSSELRKCVTTPNSRYDIHCSHREPDCWNDTGITCLMCS